MLTLTFKKSDFEGFSTGQYANIYDCPIARAAKRQLPNTEISVGGFGIRLNGNKYYFANEDGMFGTICEYAEYYKNYEFADLLPKVIEIDYTGDLVPISATPVVENISYTPLLSPQI